MDPWTEWTTAENQAPAATEDKPLFPAETGEGVGGGAAVLEQPIKRGRGRLPGDGSTYTEEKAEAMCSLVASGKTITAACELLGVPVQTQVHWRKDHPDFAINLAQARDVGYDVMADECLAIAAEKPYLDDKGKPDVSPQKLQIDTRIKLLSMWSKRYREKGPAEDNDSPDKTINVIVRIEERLQQLTQRRSDRQPVTIDQSSQPERSTPMHERLAKLQAGS